MYVPDDMTLGNPGIFGFIGQAISTVAKAVGSVVGVGPQATQPIKITVSTPATPTIPATKPASLFPQGFLGTAGGGINMQTIALIGGAILLGTILSGRGRGK
jgi:hypothetical protein